MEAYFGVGIIVSDYPCHFYFLLLCSDRVMDNGLLLRESKYRFSVIWSVCDFER